MTVTTPDPAAAGPTAADPGGAGSGVVAITASNTLDALERASKRSPDAQVLAPAGGTWSASELSELGAKAHTRDDRDLIVCGLEWLRGDLAPRLLKPLEENAREGSWLIPTSSVEGLAIPLQGRIARIDPHTEHTGDLLDALLRRSKLLPAASQNAVTQLAQLGAAEGVPAARAYALAEALKQLGEEDLVRQAGGKAAVADAVLSRIQRQVGDSLQTQPTRWDNAHRAAQAIEVARSSLVWNTPLWPVLTLALSAAAAAAPQH